MTRVALGHVAAVTVVLSLSILSARAAVITVVPFDGPGEGFNDPTPVSPIGLNAGTTVGEQRRIAVQAAADIWGAALDSSVEMLVQGSFNDLFCSDTSATLASAGPQTVHRLFFNAPIPEVWYPQALANKFAGFDVAPSDADISITFNSAVGAGCLLPASWYYGLDANPGSGELDLVTIALHELAHGLGFLSLVDLGSGQKFQGRDDAYILSLENHSACRLYPRMLDNDRVEASLDTGDLHWTGLNVTLQGGGLAAGRHPEGHVEIYAPDPSLPGSSVSHFSTTLDPNQLMEPSYLGPNHDINLSLALLNDLGWNGEFPKNANPACNDGEFRVNTETVGEQLDPDVAILADGSFLAVWTSNGINTFVGDDIVGQDGDHRGVYSQLYSPSGEPQGAEFRVNTDTVGNQWFHSVASSASGTFVVVWEGHDGYSSSGVFGQRYDSQAVPLGLNFLVNTYTTGGQSGPTKVDMDAAGNFVVVWISSDQDGDEAGVFGQRFDSTGNPLGSEFQVNTHTPESQGANGLDLTVAEDGSFVVVWKSESQDSPQIGLSLDGGVYAQRYSTTGDPLGSEFLVNTYTLNDQGTFGLAVDSDAAGNFLVTWTSVQDDGHTGRIFPYGGIFGQRFGSDGSKVGGEFQINVGVKELQWENDVAVAPTGEFLVAWQSRIKLSDSFFVSNDNDIFARLFDNAGNGVGEEFRVNGFLPGDQREPAVALDPSGDMILLFQSEYCDGSDADLCGAGPDGMANGVFGQRLSSQMPSCDPTPRSDCSAPAKSSLVMKHGNRKNLTWKWLKGSPLDGGDFGQPAAGFTHYVLCIYQDGLVPTLAMSAELPAGGTCGNRPCWKTLGKKGKGFAYRDRDAASNGLKKVLLRTGEEGRSKIIVKGRGPDLPLPTLPLANYEGLIVQLVNGNGRCWESRYSAPARKNDTGKFADKS